jgi:REP element-mobilizing transposase RayT
LDRDFYLPRLTPEHYCGDAVIHWTMPIAMRSQGWLDDLFHAQFREQLLHVAHREGLLCPVYCLMPDHLHFIWMGLRRYTDQRRGSAFLRTQVERILAPYRFQHQPHDHVLRQEDRKRNAFARTCFYVIENACAAGLVKEAAGWPFAGCVVPGYPVLHPLEGAFWPRFWKIYRELRETDAGDLNRTPKWVKAYGKSAETEKPD